MSLWSATAAAGATTFHCEGVNYLYPDGMDNGPARREAASRTLTLDLESMHAQLVSGRDVRTTQIVEADDGYHGLFPNRMELSGVTVLGEEVQIDTTAQWLELRYLLEDQRHFLSFTGDCRR